ncbi:hypothetical protein B0H14DRAFT_2613966 [Mycena olivaceomarginata]|nr:hypothetical protein B0H14DRAFT_2613966 [Mycena olivaceomarginata]
MYAIDGGRISSFRGIAKSTANIMSILKKHPKDPQRVGTIMMMLSPSRWRAARGLTSDQIFHKRDLISFVSPSLAGQQERARRGQSESGATLAAIVHALRVQFFCDLKDDGETYHIFDNIHTAAHFVDPESDGEYPASSASESVYEFDPADHERERFKRSNSSKSAGASAPGERPSAPYPDHRPDLEEFMRPPTPPTASPPKPSPKPKPRPAHRGTTHYEPPPIPKVNCADDLANWMLRAAEWPIW